MPQVVFEHALLDGHLGRRVQVLHLAAAAGTGVQPEVRAARAHALRNQVGSTISENRVRTGDAGIEGRLRATLPSDGGFFAARARVDRLPPAHRGYVVQVMSVTSVEGALDRVLDGLRIR